MVLPKKFRNAESDVAAHALRTNARPLPTRKAHTTPQLRFRGSRPVMSSCSDIYPRSYTGIIIHTSPATLVWRSPSCRRRWWPVVRGIRIPTLLAPIIICVIEQLFLNFRHQKTNLPRHIQNRLNSSPNLCLISAFSIRRRSVYGSLAVLAVNLCA